MNEPGKFHKQKEFIIIGLCRMLLQPSSVLVLGGCFCFCQTAFKTLNILLED